MDDPYQRFMQYLKLSDELIAQSGKDLVAETARVLALMVAGYQAKYGEILVEESLRLLRLEKLTDEDAAMLASGLETLVGVLGALREDASNESAGPIH
jgi:galactose-1-phosphate uridylyltransferase